jgi:hypothetical protein
MFVAVSPATPAAPPSRAAPLVLPFLAPARSHQTRVERLAQIEQERRLDVALAKAVLMGRRSIDAAHTRLGRGPNFAAYDIEEDAWAIVAEELDPTVLAVECQEALDHVRANDEDGEGIGMGCAPRARAIRARYDLAVSLGEVVAALRGKDPRDADDILSDLRARLSSDGESVDGARRALWCAVARCRRAKAARLLAEASDHSTFSTRDEGVSGALRQSEGG